MTKNANVIPPRPLVLPFQKFWRFLYRASAPAANSARKERHESFGH